MSFQKLSSGEAKKIKSFISECQIVDISNEIKKKVIKIRSIYLIKLPDAIILASALHLSYPFLTADKNLEKNYKNFLLKK